MIGIIVNDPGGTELIASWLIEKKNLKFQLCFGKNAELIIKREFGNVQPVDLKELIITSDWVLCGTSYKVDLEWRAIKLAKKYKKKSVVFLDHWVNYKKRFIRNGELILPDEIWVADNFAFRIASKKFSKLTIKLVRNPYLKKIKQVIQDKNIKTKSNPRSKKILYLCEPITIGSELNTKRIWGYTEKEAIEYFIRNLKYINKDITKLSFRPHPKENIEKYDWIKEKFDLPISVEKNIELLDQIIEADIVSGCATMGMVVGLVANKKVISFIPPSAKTIPLPFKKIIPIEKLINDKKNI